MTTKERILRVLQDLPESASIEDAMERLYVLHKIERGLADVEAGQTLSHEEVLERIKQWQK